MNKKTLLRWLTCKLASHLNLFPESFPLGDSAVLKLCGCWMVFSFLEEVYHPQLHSSWIIHEEFICLRGGQIFTSHSALVLFFLLCVKFFPLLYLFYFEHLSRTWVHLPLPVRGIFQTWCFTHFWVLLDKVLLRVLKHCSGFEQHSREQMSPGDSPRCGTGVIEYCLSSESRSECHGKGLWLQKCLAQGSYIYVQFLFGFVTNACCRQIGWLAGRYACIPACQTGPFSFRW